MPKLILAIDQGTTSSRAILYNRQLQAVAIGQQELPLQFPATGWVEQQAEDIWQSVCLSITQAMAVAGVTADDIAAIAITNQRETTLVWDNTTGIPVYPAIVWQDRRTAAECQRLKATTAESLIHQKTGLLADPYFSASKLAWILDNVSGARERAKAGQLCFGTIDCYLLWRLSGGKVHATDASNAARTMLFNIHQQQWDQQLLTLFNIPASLLPGVKDNKCHFADTAIPLFSQSIPILAMMGDQQAALLGQACTLPGMAKSTYGTGCFAVVNTGDKVLSSRHQLLSTVAWRIDGNTTYALEGSIFMAGATVQWLRDKLGIIQQAADSESLAQGVSYQQSELLIPAFTGLGAPYWQPEIRAAIFGMTRDTGKAELAAAALLSVAYQSRDLLSAIQQDGINVGSLRVDGGMTNNQWFLQALADICQQPLQCSQTVDATALGVAFLAAWQLGYYNCLSDIDDIWQSGKSFKPQIEAELANHLYSRWQNATAALIRHSIE